MGDLLGDIVLFCPGHSEDLRYQAGSQLSGILEDATQVLRAGRFSFKQGKKTYRAAAGSRVPEGRYEWKLYSPAAGLADRYAGDAAEHSGRPQAGALVLAQAGPHL
ncbi:hypothetical protein WJX72_010970 [[Myrmecia] bisecta]|uniref:Uncharacterized protein n=1 Tax=[Myrmecia] bisecta TaxID=41462 RepID=A0AAW1P3Z6_9CHLO